MRQNSTNVYHALATRRDSSVPSYFSVEGPSVLQPGAPFTLETVVCCADVRAGGTLLRSAFFRLYLQDEILYLSCVSTAAIAGGSASIAAGCLHPNEWYTLTLLYDCTQLSIYIRGRKAGFVPCSSLSGVAAASCLEIGEGLVAYFRSLILYPVCLPSREIGLLCSAEPRCKEEALARFDFDAAELTNQSPVSALSLSLHGDSRIVELVPVEQIRIDLNKEHYGKAFNGLSQALEQNGQVNCVGMIRINGFGEVSGCMSLDTEQPAVWEFGGSVNVFWREAKAK